MTTAIPSAVLLKEGRALAPVWLASAVAIVASTRLDEPLSGLFAFALGAVALGVFSIGHEYSHGTLTSLLAQPLTRSRLLLSKALVLTSMLIVLTLLSALMLLRVDGMERVLGSGSVGAQWRLAVIVLTPLLGLCVAPWLTMLCRSTVAGMVFTLAIPSGLWIAGQMARAIATDFDAARNQYSIADRAAYAADRLASGPTLMLMVVGIASVCVIAAVHARSLFVRLEALDAPRDLRRSPATRDVAAPVPARIVFGPGRHKYAHLVFKEVRLQGLAFAVAALYALSWVGLHLAGVERYVASQSFGDLSSMYGVFVALLIGAVSSAEERSLGTAQWQTLQPIAFWKQWLAKFVSISLLALLLGLALPLGLEEAFPLIVDSGAVGPRLPLYFWFSFKAARSAPVAIVLITLFGAYASTLCSGGLRALLVSLSLWLGLASIFSNVFYAIYNLRLVTHSFAPSMVRVRFLWHNEWILAHDWRALVTAGRVSGWINGATFVVFVGGILYLYLRNSRSAEHGLSMATKQVPWVAAYVVLAAVLAVASEPLLEWWFLTH